MKFINRNINKLIQHAEGKKLVCYGANDKLRMLCVEFASFGFWERVDLITDDTVTSTKFRVG